MASAEWANYIKMQRDNMLEIKWDIRDVQKTYLLA